MVGSLMVGSLMVGNAGYRDGYPMSTLAATLPRCHAALGTRRSAAWAYAVSYPSGLAHGAVHAVRVAILTRLWANTPCPQQVRANRMAVSSVRLQPRPVRTVIRSIAGAS